MKKTILLVAIGLISSSLLALGQEFYRWTDEKGTLHLTDDLTLVPEKYREQTKKKEPPKEPPPPVASKPSKEVSPKEGSVRREPVRAPQQKDLLGRGEDWWRAKATEWNEKLIHAKKNYESAYADWKSKEKELEQSKFKPDSFKRKLKAEIQMFEARAKDWERQVGEAKKMLEKVLPKEAEEYRADPRWLKIEK